MALVVVSDKSHLRAVFTDLHQFDLVSIRIMCPALPVEISTLLRSIILRSARIKDLLPCFMNIIYGNTDMEKTDILILIRMFNGCTIKQFDELSSAAINVYDPRLAVLGSCNIKRLLKTY